MYSKKNMNNIKENSSTNFPVLMLEWVLHVR